MAGHSSRLVDGYCVYYARGLAGNSRVFLNTRPGPGTNYLAGRIRLAALCTEIAGAKQPDEENSGKQQNLFHDAGIKILGCPGSAGLAGCQALFAVQRCKGAEVHKRALFFSR